MALCDLKQLLVAFEDPVEVLDFVFRDYNIVLAADEHGRDIAGGFFEQSQVVLREEGEFEFVLDLLAQKVGQQLGQHFRHAGFLLNDPLYNCIQVSEGTVQNKFVDDLGVLDRKIDGCYRPHAPPPHRQPLHIYVFVRLS